MSHPAKGPFTDRKNAVSYQEAEGLIRAYLNTLPHGGLKEFVDREFTDKNIPGLNYTSLVSLKNKKLSRPAPLAVQRVLRTLGYETEVQRAPDKSTHLYTFKKPKDLAAFKDAYNANVTTDPEPDADKA
jgi:hypothetical protein